MDSHSDELDKLILNEGDSSGSEHQNPQPDGSPELAQNGPCSKTCSAEIEENLDEQVFNEFTPREAIDYLGFGRAQYTAIFILCFAFMSGFSTIQLQPFLSGRLYVEMQLTPQQEAVLSFSSLFGLIFASFPFGFLADKIGRKNSTVVSCFLLAFWNLMTCLAPSYQWIVLLRLLVSLSRGCVITGITYFKEFLPSNKLWLGPLLGNQIAGTILGDTLSISVALFLLTDPTLAWQYYVIAMSAPMAIFIFLALVFLDEPPQYLMVKGRITEAHYVIKRMARQNKKQLPKNFRLIISRDPNLQVEQKVNFETIKRENREQYWSLVKSCFTNWRFVRTFCLLITITAAGRMVNDGLNFILTDLLFIQGQAGTYCNGAKTQTYYLTQNDYLKILLAQLTSVLSIIILVPILARNIKLKFQAIVCFSACIVLSLFLFTCPNYLWAICILSLIRISMQVMNVTGTLTLLELNMPSTVRGFIQGLGGSARTIPLPFYPLLTNILSKESQHYVTTVTLVVMATGLVAGILIPRNVNDGLEDEE